MAVLDFLGINVTLLIEVHVSMRSGGGLLSVVDSDNFAALGGIDHHEATASDVSGPGQGDSQGKTHGHGRIHRVPTLLQDVYSNFRCHRLAGHNHAIFGSNGREYILVSDVRLMCVS